MAATNLPSGDGERGDAFRGDGLRLAARGVLNVEANAMV
jgi:hypothetical protein